VSYGRLLALGFFLAGCGDVKPLNPNGTTSSGNGSSSTGTTGSSTGTTGSSTGTTGASTGTTGSGGGPDMAISGAPDGGTSGSSTGTTGSSTGSTGSGGGPDMATPPLPSGTAQIRVHYPAGTHAVTVRGSGAGLTWTAGTATTASGDIYTVNLSGLTATIEWKPLLDDTTWAIGPNYHVASTQSLDVYPHFTTQKGTVKVLISAFKSSVLNDTRAIYAYLPPSYNENTDATYPVVYMHDGQNLWAAMPSIAFSVPWNVDTAFDNASQNGACTTGGVVGWGGQPLGGTAVTCNGDADCTSSHDCRTFPEAIVIGIANDSNRIYEYTQIADPSEASLGPAGGADQYIKMIITELKPTIDSMLRTRPDVGSTAMCGSSLGGLVTAYAGLKRADVFGLIAELSPSTWWDSDDIVGKMKLMPTTPRPQLVYLDSGSGTADDEADTDMLASTYVSLGYVDGTTVRHVVQPGAQHGETYWAERFPGAMQFILGSR
jgi:predicted alpha/beta superfamily hydrolase